MTTTPPGTVLPHPDTPFRGVIRDTYAASTPDWPDRNLPPVTAPHIVMIMCDDLGFGQLSCYGGPIAAPNIAALAAGGLRYNNFHTTALCSPTRAALLTGRNHHSVGFSAITEMASGFPGHNAFLPRSAASVAEVLRQSGYSTYAVGKWHLTPTAEATAAGPFDRWPLGQGFERFYGFLPGEVDHWHPMVTVDNHRVPTPDTPGYHLTEDLIDQGIKMLRDQRQVASGRPVFLYVPFGAPHCPFHAPQAYIDQYRGHFDAGWDIERQRTFERQKAMGIIPANTDLPPRNPHIKPWDALSADEQRLYCRLMETFAGMVEHTDAQIGRLMDVLKDLDMFDNTLVLFLSDNGASQEGQVHGTTNTERFRNLMPMSVAEMLPQLDEIGSHTTDPHYPMGWAMAGNAPFQRYKRDTHRGGNTDPLIAHWPARIKDAGAIRSQYHHVTDIYPTLLEVAGLSVPARVNGVDQMRLEGQSLASTLFDAAAPQVKQVQYYEMLGSRAIWQDGWTAVTWHRPGTDWAKDKWELYHQDNDYSQAHDVSAEHPDRLQAMIARWWDEARVHNVLPLDDRGRERFTDPTRPTASLVQDVYRYYPGTSPVPNPSLPIILNCPHSFTVHFSLRTPTDSGVLVAHGAELGGWALLVRDRAVTYVNNYLKISTTSLTTSSALPIGRDIKLTYVWQPSGVGKGTVQLLIDGVIAVEAPDVPTAPMGYSMVQEGLQIGRSWGTPVSPAHYHGDFTFSGNLRVVELRTDPAQQMRAG